MLAAVLRRICRVKVLCIVSSTVVAELTLSV